MTTAVEFLAGAPEADGSWTFAIGRERHGAFGGAFGGVVSACCVTAARSLAPERVAASLDVNDVRGLPAGTARVIPTVVHGGRSLRVEVRSDPCSWTPHDGPTVCFRSTPAGASALVRPRRRDD